MKFDIVVRKRLENIAWDLTNVTMALDSLWRETGRPNIMDKLRHQLYISAENLRGLLSSDDYGHKEEKDEPIK